MLSFYSGAITFFLILGITVGTESFMDYGEENADRDMEGLREFYRLLLRRNAIDNSMGSQSSIGNIGLPYEHLMIRKSQRSPSLRLRFGRSGPAMPPTGLLTRPGSNSALDEN